MSNLRKQVVKLAKENPGLRPHLLPLLFKQANVIGEVARIWSKQRGVLKVTVRKRKKVGNEEQVFIDIYLHPEAGARMGANRLSKEVTQRLTRVLGRYPIRVERFTNPHPGMDPSGKAGVSWDTHADEYKHYYARNPMRFIGIMESE